jgi:hypothetical protein
MGTPFRMQHLERALRKLVGLIGPSNAFHQLILLSRPCLWAVLASLFNRTRNFVLVHKNALWREYMVIVSLLDSHSTFNLQHGDGAHFWCTDGEHCEYLGPAYARSAQTAERTGSRGRSQDHRTHCAYTPCKGQAIERSVALQLVYTSFVASVRGGEGRE